MAIHVDHPANLSVPALSYAEIRPQLQSGDLLFCCGNYLVSEAIQHVTCSPWSHVAIVLRVEAIDRVLLLESVEDTGVRLSPLSKYTTDYEDGKPYKGELVFARVEHCSADLVRGIATFGADQLTQPYNQREIAEILARVTLHLGRINKSAGWLCSELVAACFRAAGSCFTCDEKNFISPEDVWLEPSVQATARVAF